MRTITLEEHVTTERVLQATPGAHAISGDMAQYMQRMSGFLLDMGAGRIAAMDAGGIDMQVLSLGSRGLNELDPALAVELCEDANQQMSAAVATYPSRLAAFAAIPSRLRNAPRRCSRPLSTEASKEP